MTSSSDGATGLLCAPGDASALAEAIMRMEDADLRQRHRRRRLRTLGSQLHTGKLG